jgi:positive regulator of sigma E activity
MAPLTHNPILLLSPILSPAATYCIFILSFYILLFWISPLLPIDDPFPHLFEMREALVVIGSVLGYILLAGYLRKNKKRRKNEERKNELRFTRFWDFLLRLTIFF